MSSDHLKIVPFAGGNLADVPGALRRLADLIERGPEDDDCAGFRGGVKSLVWVTLDANNDTAIGCIGQNVDKFKAAGIVQQGVIALLLQGSSS